MRKINVHLPEAQLQHINVRTEGNDKEPIFAVDLKIEGVCTNSLSGLLSGVDQTPPLWTAEGNPALTGISSFPSIASFEGAHVKFGDMILLDNLDLKGCKLNKFVFAPITGAAMKIAFRIQLRPTDEEFTQLKKNLKKKAPMDLEFMLGYAGDDASHLMRAADEAEEQSEQDDLLEAMEKTFDKEQPAFDENLTEDD